MITLPNGLTEGLITAIEQAEHSIWHDDGVPFSSDDVAVQAIVDAYGLADFKKEKKAEIDALADEKRKLVTALNSPAKLIAGLRKWMEAIAFDGNDASAPKLAKEAAKRGVTTQKVVNRVLAKAEEFSNSEADIAGVCGKHKDAIIALTTPAAVLSYNVTTGWPV